MNQTFIEFLLEQKSELIAEMSSPDIIRIQNELNAFLKPKGLGFRFTAHAAIDRLLNDKSRADIEAGDFIHTVQELFANERFIKRYKDVIAILGVVTNSSTGLNIVFKIFMKNFFIITAIVEKDFKTDNTPRERFWVK
jgi:hypothetical protein